MELRQLACFVAVAEERHFGRAAERVHLSQSALSRQIQHLEADLGTQLLDRSTRRATLTASGQAFLRDAREVLRWADRARESARDAAGGRTGTLRLGFVSSAAVQLLPTVLRAFREGAAQASVHLVERFPDEVLDALRAREVDLGLSRGPFEDTDGLVVEPLAEEPLVALLPRQHRLAAYDTVPLSALAAEPFVLPPRHHAQGFVRVLYALCGSVGFAPRVVEETEPMATIVAFVAAGMGVTIAPASVGARAQGHLVGRPLSGVPPHVTATTALSFVWRDGDLPPVADRFRREAAALGLAAEGNGDRHSYGSPPPIPQGQVPDSSRAGSARG
ncbi:MAG: LysR substrate-binding domain-containing protein [Bacteroidota bacterium]